MFTIKIWVRPSGGDGRVTSPAHSAGGLSPKRGAGSGEELEKDSKLVFERTLDLSDLVYLGTLVCLRGGEREGGEKEGGGDSGSL